MFDLSPLTQTKWLRQRRDMVISTLPIGTIYKDLHNLPVIKASNVGAAKGVVVVFNLSGVQLQYNASDLRYVSNPAARGQWGDNVVDKLQSMVIEMPPVHGTATGKSDGSSADYYTLPENSTQLQDLISHRNMNAQIGEIFRATYRYGLASHSDQLRDAKKIKFYAEAEIARLEKLNDRT